MCSNKVINLFSLFYTIYFYEGLRYFYKSDKYVMNADEMSIELPIKFDAMFLSKGFYLFLNTTKPDKILFLTNLYLKVFDLKSIYSYFLRSNRLTFLTEQRNDNSFIIFYSIFLQEYCGFIFFF